MGRHTGAVSRIGKNRNGGESFEELGKEREWGVTQGGSVGKEQWRRFYTCPLFSSRGAA